MDAPQKLSSDLSKTYDDSFFDQHIENKSSYDKLVVFFKNRITNITDYGCGHGLLVEAFLKVDIDAYGIEGSMSAVHCWNKEHINKFSIIDFTKLYSEDAFPKTDFVITTEVAEHIDYKYAEQFVKYLTIHNPKKVYFSAATFYQDLGLNPSHVNEQSFTYWISIFNKFGYDLDLKECYDLKKFFSKDCSSFSKCWWYIKNLIVFKKTNEITLDDFKDIPDDEMSFTIRLSDNPHNQQHINMLFFRDEIDYMSLIILKLFKLKQIESEKNNVKQLQNNLQNLTEQKINIPNPIDEDLSKTYDETFFNQHNINCESYSKLVEYFKNKITNITDYGCGHGLLVQAFIDAGIDAYGIEGSESAKSCWNENNINKFKIIDFTKEYNANDFPETEYVISTEVAEHINSEYALQFVKYLTIHNPKKVYFGAATYFQDMSMNSSHVNEQSFGYWVNMFNKVGYDLDIRECYELKKFFSNDLTSFKKCWWYPKNLLAFKKTNTVRLDDFTEIKDDLICFTNKLSQNEIGKKLSNIVFYRDEVEYMAMILLKINRLKYIDNEIKKHHQNKENLKFIGTKTGI